MREGSDGARIRFLRPNKENVCSLLFFVVFSDAVMLCLQYQLAIFEEFFLCLRLIVLEVTLTTISSKTLMMWHGVAHTVGTN